MIWINAEFISQRTIAKDALDNDIMEDVVFRTYAARLSAWTSEENNALGREYTESHRKLVTKASTASCKDAAKVRLNGKVYLIEKTIGDDTSRWRILHLKGFFV